MRRMGRFKFILGIFAVLGVALAVYFVLSGENALVTHPQGQVARGQLNLITINLLLMLIVVVPTYVFLFVVIWKYRAKNTKQKPERTHKVYKQWVLWLIPLIVVIPMGIITWFATHALDPYKPIEGKSKPLKIQVVALDWKWLFIYPEQGIAMVNVVQFPAETPIHFELCSDGAPMNSFWIPELCGQIYAMTGMVTSLHMMADKPGSYAGRAAEINGEGLADMTFIATSLPPSDFNGWVTSVKRSSLQLNSQSYEKLAEPSVNHPIVLYSHAENELFNKIVAKYQPPQK